MRLSIGHVGKAIKALTETLRDYRRYVYWSTTCRSPKTPDQFEARITAHYHVLEKGLSLPSPREGFGTEMALSLIDLIERYRELHPYRSSTIVRAALSAINEYRKFNEKALRGTTLYERLARLDVDCEYGGVDSKDRDSLLVEWRQNFSRLASNRHSIRNFTGDPVPRDSVVSALNTARWTPSVCNRQAWRVVSVEDPKVRKNALALQTGNRGFGETLGGLLVVVMNLEAFHGVEERHQAWIDGGMFSMSLIHALCSEGIGSCPLNWCASRRSDDGLRKLLSLDDSAVIIMMIGIGMLPETVRIAKSHRKEIDAILRIV